MDRENEDQNDWSSFVDFSSDIILHHPDPNFVITIALLLGDTVYKCFNQWKLTPEGIQATNKVKVKKYWNYGKAQRQIVHLVFLSKSLTS